MTRANAVQRRVRTGAARAARALAKRLPIAELAVAIGVPEVADRLVGAEAEGLVGVCVPAAFGGRPRRLWMHHHGGDDQVARALRDGGLWAFEPPLAPLFVELVRRSPGAVVDAGANTGLYSLLAAAARSSARVYAFEPVPAIADLFEANLRRNLRIARRVHLRRAALGEASGRAALYLPPPTGTTVETSASLDPGFKATVGEVLDVEVLTLDDVWRTAGSPPLCVVKIDTEGTEHRVVRGAATTIASARPVVVCEVLARAEVGELSSVLSPHGYVDVRLYPDSLLEASAIEFDPDAWNHAFVPEEKLGVLAGAARAIGLTLRRPGS